MSKKWAELLKFQLPQEELDNVFLLTGEIISLKEQYADTIATALSKQIPGRYTSFSKPTINKNSYVFRFVKQCSSSLSCKKKWKIVCLTGCLLEGRNEFSVSTNDIDCNHEQPPIPRPLAGKYLNMVLIFCAVVYD